MVRARRGDPTSRGVPELRSDRTGQGRSVVQVPDPPISGCPVRLVRKRCRWPCRHADYECRSFTEESELIEGSLTRSQQR